MSSKPSKRRTSGGDLPGSKRLRRDNEEGPDSDANAPSGSKHVPKRRRTFKSRKEEDEALYDPNDNTDQSSSSGQGTELSKKKKTISVTADQPSSSGQGTQPSKKKKTISITTATPRSAAIIQRCYRTSIEAVAKAKKELDALGEEAPELDVNFEEASIALEVFAQLEKRRNDLQNDNLSTSFSRMNPDMLLRLGVDLSPEVTRPLPAREFDERVKLRLESLEDELIVNSEGGTIFQGLDGFLESCGDLMYAERERNLKTTNQVSEMNARTLLNHISSPMREHILNSSKLSPFFYDELKIPGRPSKDIRAVMPVEITFVPQHDFKHFKANIPVTTFINGAVDVGLMVQELDPSEHSKILESNQLSELLAAFKSCGGVRELNMVFVELKNAGTNLEGHLSQVISQAIAYCKVTGYERCTWILTNATGHIFGVVCANKNGTRASNLQELDQRQRGEDGLAGFSCHRTEVIDGSSKEGLKNIFRYYIYAAVAPPQAFEGIFTS